MCHFNITAWLSRIRMVCISVTRITLRIWSIHQYVIYKFTWHWRHNERDGTTKTPTSRLCNQPSRHISNKTSKLSVAGLCEGNSPLTCEFTSQRASNAGNVPFRDVIINADCCGWTCMLATAVFGVWRLRYHLIRKPLSGITSPQDSTR